MYQLYIKLSHEYFLTKVDERPEEKSILAFDRNTR